jgi:hypothetical protein
MGDAENGAPGGGKYDIRLLKEKVEFKLKQTGE